MILVGLEPTVLGLEGPRDIQFRHKTLREPFLILLPSYRRALSSFLDDFNKKSTYDNIILW